MIAQVSVLLLLMSILMGESAIASMREAFSRGTVKGHIRLYHNYRDFKNKTDTKAVSIGPTLHAQTDATQFWQLGGTFYMANDLGLNSTDSGSVTKLLPATDIEILGESYLRIKALESKLYIGRKAVETPFANSSDAFMIPVTFNGIFLSNKSVENLTVNFHILESIKNRQSNQFQNVGAFATSRFGQEQADSNGARYLGLKYKFRADGNDYIRNDNYQYLDLFNLYYVAAQKYIELASDFSLVLEGQVLREDETHRALLGEVDVLAFGLRSSLIYSDWKLQIGFNQVEQKSDSFLNGSILTPYTFFTDPLYTNSMLSGLGNTDAGSALKVSLFYSPVPVWWFKISYSNLNLQNRLNNVSGSDQAEIDFDLKRKFLGDLKNFSVRIRIAILDSDNDTQDLNAVRTQLQYKF